MDRRLAIFDFDGTLADSGPWFARVLNDVARAHGFREISANEREMLRDRTSREVMTYLGVPMWKLPAIMRSARKMAARDIEQIPLFPWVEEVFDDLARANVAIAVVSSNTEDNIRRVLGRRVAARVQHIAAGASMFGKPAKLRVAVKACGVAKTLTASIGDEVRDIEAANAAGIDSVAVTWGYASAAALEAAQPTRLVSDPAHLLEWLTRDAQLRS